LLALKSSESLIVGERLTHAILFAPSLPMGISIWGVRSTGCHRIFQAREVGLSQNVVELLAFGSMNEFVLVKFA
jgi:hypothetical protein